MLIDPTQVTAGFKFLAAGMEAEVVEVVQTQPEPMVNWRYLHGSTIWKDRLSDFMQAKNPMP